MIKVRRAGAFDASEMAQLLNEIIAGGGTTARATPVTRKDMEVEMSRDAERSAWHVAIDGGGKIVGFQSIAPLGHLPPEAADISTFVQVGQTGLGIGSALFEATRQVAKELGYAWINANIRADNEGGLIYYQSRGFEDYGVIEGHRMSNGQVVDKRLKRYDL